MSNIDINDFFKASADLFADKKEQKAKGLYVNKLALEKGHNYLVRLLPYLKEGASGLNKTIFHFYTYAWRSCRDGRWIYMTSPKTWGEKCPITEYYFAIMNSDNEAAKARVGKDKLSFKESWYYNVYVVDDPVNPENNGTVKYIQAGKQLNNIIAPALSQDPDIMAQNAEEYGVENMSNAVFDLSSNGINLSINVLDQGGFADYKTSRWTGRRRDLGLSDEEIKAAYDSVFDLTQIERQHSRDEVCKIFTETFLDGSDSTFERAAGAGESGAAPKPVKKTPVVKEELEDEPEMPTESVDLDELEKYLKDGEE